MVRTANGTVVRLSAVASIQPGVRNNLSAGWYNGQQAVVLDIQRQPGANIVATVAAVKEALPTLQNAPNVVRWLLERHGAR